MKSLFNAGTPSFGDFINRMSEESNALQQKVEDHMNQTIVKRKKLMKMMGISSTIHLHATQIGHHLCSKIENSTERNNYLS